MGLLAYTLPAMAILSISAVSGGMYSLMANYNANFAGEPIRPAEFLSSDGWFSLVWAYLQDNVDQELVAYKQELFGNLGGGGLKILEYGPGYGINFRYFNGSDVTVVEPNKFMHAKMRAEAEAFTLSSLTILSSEEEAAALAPESFDVAVTTLSLCSVPDPRATVKTIYGALRPYGQLLYLEHVAAKRGSFLRTVQKVVQPAWAPVSGGCHLTREIDVVVRGQPWHMANAVSFNISSGGVGLIRDYVRGYAIKPAHTAPADPSLLILPPQEPGEPIPIIDDAAELMAEAAEMAAAPTPSAAEEEPAAAEEEVTEEEPAAAEEAPMEAGSEGVAE